MIDFHTHIFPEKIASRTLSFLSERCQTKPATNGMAEGLLASMEEAGLDCSIALPVVTKPSQFDSINRFACEFQEGQILSFGGIHPESKDYKGQLNILKQYGFKGIKLHPDYQGVFIDDIHYKRIISYATELDLIVSIHAGFDPGYPECTHCTPERIYNMFKDVRPEKLVLAHMGGFMRWDEVEECLVGLPVWFDTAVVFGKISDEQFMRIARKHGTDKIMFATDSPWAGQKEFVEHLKGLPFTDAEKQAIFHGNAEKLLEMKIG